VVAVILSIVVLKEPITIFSTIGAFFIIIAIALVSVKDKKINASKAEKSPCLPNA
jgi:drug/metabolite transporter (DMT)-like permease